MIADTEFRAVRMDMRCTLWPSTGLRVLADGFTVQHIAPSTKNQRPLTAFLGSPLSIIGGYYEVRMLACSSKRSSFKMGLFDPDANRSRTIPLVEDMLVCLSSDTGVLIVKTKDGSKRVACTTFGPGDTI